MVSGTRAAVSAHSSGPKAVLPQNVRGIVRLEEEEPPTAAWLANLCQRHRLACCCQRHRRRAHERLEHSGGSRECTGSEKREIRKRSVEALTLRARPA